jgi:hypothetical protein
MHDAAGIHQVYQTLMVDHSKRGEGGICTRATEDPSFTG